MSYRISIDVGGSFTDLLVFDEYGSLERSDATFQKATFLGKNRHALFFQPVKEVLEESIFEIEEKSRLN